MKAVLESSLLATICCLQQQNESSFVATISLPSKCGVANVSQFKLYELNLIEGHLLEGG